MTSARRLFSLILTSVLLISATGLPFQTCSERCGEQCCSGQTEGITECADNSCCILECDYLINPFSVQKPVVKLAVTPSVFTFSTVRLFKNAEYDASFISRTVNRKDQFIFLGKLLI
jgi:hypothetical protein